MAAKPKCLLRDLPDEVLLHIFSFLQVRDIVRLRILSRSFHKAICVSSIPSFLFSNNPYFYKCKCTDVCDFMKNVVSQNRPHYLTINRISFSSLCKNVEHKELHEQWITQLFEAFRVDELSLDYALPSIFSSLPKFQSLKVLKLTMSHFCTVTLPMLPKLELASLDTLHIKSIKTVDSISEWISQSFPSLKYLLLQNITDWTNKEDFKIRNSCLEDLSIYDLRCPKPVRIISENLLTLNCFIHSNVPEHTTKFVLETCAPNLQRLTWIGDSHPNLLSEDEEMSEGDEMLEDYKINTTRRWSIVRESNLNLLIQLFKAIPSASELHIDTEVLQHWVRIPHGQKDLHGEAPISLENLRHVGILVQEYIKAEDYITFLERLPSLETLTLTVTDDPDEIYDADFYPCLDERSVRGELREALRNCRKLKVGRTKGLKKVKLIIKELDDNIFNIFGLLMKSCTDLEEIMLYYASRYHNSMKKVGFKYLRRFQRASLKPPSFHFFPQNLLP